MMQSHFIHFDKHTWPSGRISILLRAGAFAGIAKGERLHFGSFFVLFVVVVIIAVVVIVLVVVIADNFLLALASSIRII